MVSVVIETYAICRFHWPLFSLQGSQQLRASSLLIITAIEAKLTDFFNKSSSGRMQKRLRQRFPNFLWMIFSSKLLSLFSMSAIYSFLKYLCYRQAKTTVKIYNPGLDRLGATHFLTLHDPCLSRDLLWEPLV